MDLRYIVDKYINNEYVLCRKYKDRQIVGSNKKLYDDEKL
jgi:hypothetical protein